MLTIIDKEAIMTGTISTPGLSTADRVALRILAGIAVGIGVIILVTGGYRTYVLAFAAGETPIELLTQAEVPHDDDGSPVLVSAEFTNADVLASGLTDGTRALLAIGSGLGTLTGVVIAAAIAILFILLSRGRPFARPLYLFSLIAGATLTLGTMLAQFIAGFGQMGAATELNPGADDVFVVGFEFDPTPWLVGFAVMALAFVFRAGARLQRDTEGLV
jgi:hypothetical protein